MKDIKFSRRMRRLSSSLVRELLALTEKPDVISFAGGLPAQALMPALEMSNAADAVRQYGLTDGERSLRERVATLMSQSGLQCQSAQILMTAGSQQGIDLVAKLFIDEGTTIFVEKPAYLAALQVFNLFGAKVVGIDIGPEGIDLVMLEQKLKKHKPAFIYINPTFQNPTGYCYSDNTRIQLAKLLDAYAVPLIEDNPYGELRYDVEANLPVASYLKTVPWVYLGTFSKIAIPAWRIGYTVSHLSVATYLARVKQGTDLHTNRPGQWWCDQFLQDKTRFNAHLKTLRAYYTGQRNAMEAALQKYMHDIASWNTPQGGLFYWIKFDARIDTANVLNEALDEKVAFLPGVAFYPEDCAERNAIRISFSEVSLEDIDTGINKLSTIFRRVLANV